MNATHTPGPWCAIEGDTLNSDRPWGICKYLTLEECQEIDGDEAEFPSRTIVLAEVTSGPTAEKDAKLLAAAPALYAACEAALRCLASIERTEPYIIHAVNKAVPAMSQATQNTIDGWKRNLEHARAALAAARGE